MSDRMTKYHALVYPMNRHPSYGEKVIVLATSFAEARARAKKLAGWVANPEDARVIFDLIEDIQ